jgi:hypothetical protein
MFDVLAQCRFMAARQEIERQPCLKPLRTIVWTTAEEMDRDRNKSWRDMGNGVFWMVGEYNGDDGEAD